MNMLTNARIALLLFVLAALTACGNKGPLVMPDAKPADQPESAAPAEPASPEPATEPAKTESGTPAR